MTRVVTAVRDVMAGESGSGGFGTPVRGYVLVAAVTVCLVAIGLLGTEVLRRLEVLETARADNVEWALAQTEVEALDLRAAILDAARAEPPTPAQLAHLRRRFDILYSRTAALGVGPIYGELAEDPVYREALAALRRWIDATVPAIDGGDAALAAALPRLARESAEVRADARALSLAGIERFAAAADAQRAAIADTLLRLGAVLVGMILALLGALVLLFLTNRENAARARALAATSARLETIVTTALDAVLVADEEGRVLEINGAAEAIFGYARDEAVGRSLSDLVVPEQHRAAHEAGMARHRAGGSPRVVGRGRIQIEARRKSGAIFPVELSIERAETEAGPVFVSFVRDISARKAAEAELMEARDRALAGEKAKAEFLAMMSHEMRTPLNGMLGTLALMRDTRLSTAQRRHLENMEASGRLLLGHVSDVLDISRFEAGKLSTSEQALDPGALVDEILDSQRSLGAAAGNRLDSGWVGPPVEAVRSDANCLRRVLVNLVGNAVKFTRNGTVTVEIEAVGTGPGAELEFRVIDTGIGIPEEKLERIFDDFVTGDTAYGRRAGGTGLGLGIARRMAEALGGTLGAESEPGEGSLFWLRIPLRAAPAAELPRPPAPGEDAARAPLEILVVEDNRINREVLREMLALGGHRVTEAMDGEEGVRLAEAVAFDVILMDVSMPIVDGFEATRRIRAGNGPSRDVPIIAVTAHAMPEEIAACGEAGMTDHLIKPISIDALEARLAARADRAAGSARHRGALAEGPAPAPVLDEAQLAELHGQIGGHALSALRDRFLTEIEGTLAGLQDPWTAGSDLSDAALAAHHAAGTAATFGAVRLRRRFLEVESAAKAGDAHAIGRALPGLVLCWQETRAALDRYAQRRLVPPARRASADPEADAPT